MHKYNIKNIKYIKFIEIRLNNKWIFIQKNLEME